MDKHFLSNFSTIEANRDVTFDEDTTFSRSRQIHSDEAHEEEPKPPRVRDIVMEERTSEENEDHDMTETQRLRYSL